MNLLLLEPGSVTEDRAVLRGDQARHVITVLRAGPGAALRIGLLDGPRGTATVRAVGADTVELTCAFEPAPPPRPGLDLLLALPRPKVMKRLWAQLAALGVDRIILTNAARVERNYFDTHVLDPGFYTPLLIEGLQQARDTRLPRVSIHRQFKPLVEDELDGLSDAPARLVADPEAAHGPAFPTPGQRVLLAVGPEGGWVDFERDLLRAHGFQPFHLGPRTLRTDTACIALLSVVAYACGESRGETPACNPQPET